MAQFIIFGSAIAYTIAFARVHAGLKNEHDPMEIIRVERRSIFFRGFLVMVLVPSFGKQYAQLLWFVSALIAANIFTSTYIPSRQKLLACLTPPIVFIIHYLYWNIPLILAGEPGRFSGKVLQGVEIGFMVLMTGLFFQVRSSLESNTRLAANVTLNQAIIKDIVLM